MPETETFQLGFVVERPLVQAESGLALGSGGEVVPMELPEAAQKVLKEAFSKFQSTAPSLSWEIFMAALIADPDNVEEAMRHWMNTRTSTRRGFLKGSVLASLSLALSFLLGGCGGGRCRTHKEKEATQRLHEALPNLPKGFGVGWIIVPGEGIVISAGFIENKKDGDQEECKSVFYPIVFGKDEKLPSYPTPQERKDWLKKHVVGGDKWAEVIDGLSPEAIEEMWGLLAFLNNSKFRKVDQSGLKGPQTSWDPDSIVGWISFKILAEGDREGKVLPGVVRFIRELYVNPNFRFAPFPAYGEFDKIVDSLCKALCGHTYVFDRGQPRLSLAEIRREEEGKVTLTIRSGDKTVGIATVEDIKVKLPGGADKNLSEFLKPGVGRSGFYISGPGEVPKRAVVVPLVHNEAGVDRPKLLIVWREKSGKVKVRIAPVSDAVRGDFGFVSDEVLLNYPDDRVVITSRGITAASNVSDLRSLVAFYGLMAAAGSGEEAYKAMQQAVQSNEPLSRIWKMVAERLHREKGEPLTSEKLKKLVADSVLRVVVGEIDPSRGDFQVIRAEVPDPSDLKVVCLRGPDGQCPLIGNVPWTGPDTLKVKGEGNNNGIPFLAVQMGKLEAELVGWGEIMKWVERLIPAKFERFDKGIDTLEVVLSIVAFAVLIEALKNPTQSLALARSLAEGTLKVTRGVAQILARVLIAILGAE